MKLIFGVSSAVLILCSFFIPARGARILGIIPTPLHSHQIAYNAFWRALAARGHELVLITCKSDLADVNNITLIDVDNDKFMKHVDFVKFSLTSSWVQDVANFLKMGYYWGENVFQHPDVRALVASGNNKKFDLVMAEMLLVPAMFGFAAKFNSALIGLSPLPLSIMAYYTTGDIILTSHQSVWEMERAAGSDLSFWQRLKNYIGVWWLIYQFDRNGLIAQDKLIKEYLGSDMPSIYEIQKNISVIFLNQDHRISFARPQLPHIIPFNSFTIKTNPDPLSKDLENFLQNATNGFIYFSLGDTVKCIHLPLELQHMLIDLFSKLPYKVIWKYEGQIPKTADNIHTGKWMPQQGLLAHPKIKLFISQGGLQSIQEAIHYKVPLVLIPIIADQFQQAKRLQSIGASRYIDIIALTRERLEEAIHDVAMNKSYKENIVKLSNSMRENPYDVLANAVWWTEFVLRHKGAPQFYSSTRNERWYERQEIDVVAVLTIVIFLTILYVVLTIVRIVVRLHKCCMIYRTPKKIKTA